MVVTEPIVGITMVTMARFVINPFSLNLYLATIYPVIFGNKTARKTVPATYIAEFRIIVGIAVVPYAL